MICVTCKSDRDETCFKPSRKNVRGFSLHCTDCEHARRMALISKRKKCNWCQKILRYRGLCNMHAFRARQLIQIGHSWSDFEQKEPWLIQRETVKCKWCESEHYGKGLCRRHWERAERAVKRGASWADFENSEPMPMEKVEKVKAEKPPKPPKPPKESKRKIVDGKMVCSDCFENKPVDEYYKSKTYITGILGRCKTCHNKKCIQRHNRRLKDDADYIKKAKEYKKQWKIKNPDKVTQYIKKWAMRNPEKVREYRKRPYTKLSNNLRKRLREFVKGQRQFPGVGCTRDILVSHIESLWDDGMTWENYGQWHIDHIMPCSSFDLMDPKQIAECFHYTNLQPLWAKENIMKSNKVVYRKGEAQLGFVLSTNHRNKPSQQ